MYRERGGGLLAHTCLPRCNFCMPGDITWWKWGHGTCQGGSGVFHEGLVRCLPSPLLPPPPTLPSLVVFALKRVTPALTKQQFPVLAVLLLVFFKARERERIQSWQSKQSQFRYCSTGRGRASQ